MLGEKIQIQRKLQKRGGPVTAVQGLLHYDVFMSGIKSKAKKAMDTRDRSIIHGIKERKLRANLNIMQSHKVWLSSGLLLLPSHLPSEVDF